MKRNRNRNQVNASLSVTLTVLGGSFLAASPHSRILSFWKTELTSSFVLLASCSWQLRRLRRLLTADCCGQRRLHGSVAPSRVGSAIRWLVAISPQSALRSIPFRSVPLAPCRSESCSVLFCSVLFGSVSVRPHPQEQQQELTREPGLGSDQFLAKLFPKSRPF